MEPHCYSIQPADLSHHECTRGPTDWTNHLLISGNVMDKRRKIRVLFCRFGRKEIEELFMANNNPRFKFSVTCRSKPPSYTKPWTSTTPIPDFSFCH
jgi:hypothetical protein